MKNFAALLFLLLAPLAFGHVGSPDVFYEGDAGPYHLLVAVRPPAMIPGVAQVDIRTTQGEVQTIKVVPVYLTAKDKGLPPTPDVMKTVAGDAKSFTGSVWLMASGSWEVRVEVEGSQGSAVLGVPVAAFARRTLPMQKALGALLFALMLFLAFGIVAIAGAAAREGQVDPGTPATPKRVRLGRIAMIVAAVMVFSMIYLGNAWWNSEASSLKHDMLYKAPPLDASLNGDRLVLKMGLSNWHELRKKSWSMTLIPDHGHLMHLFLLRVPAMDRFYHLHPEQTQDGNFALDLPAVDAGHYKLFADIVRESGFPDTMVSDIDLPQIAGKSLSGDDSAVSCGAFSGADLSESALPDGSKMIWERESRSPVSSQLNWFKFRVVRPDGTPVNDLEPYMGMAGHAVFIRSDEQVFAHIHPAGSVPMAALEVVQKDVGASSAMPHSMSMPAEVSFPYGFPQPGDYRMFVQVKRMGRVETGVFDTKVVN